MIRLAGRDGGREVDHDASGAARAAPEEPGVVCRRWPGGALAGAGNLPRSGQATALDALMAGKEAWSSLREAVLDRANAAGRCQEWCNHQGMRHRVVTRVPDQKGF